MRRALKHGVFYFRICYKLFFYSCNILFLQLLYEINAFMLYLTIILFAIAAIIGVIILKNWLTSAKTARTVIYAHGIFAAAALVLLLVHTLNNPSSALQTSLAIFIAAALGGFYMFFRELKGILSPTWLGVVHGLLAIVAFGVLVFTII
jgi:hypothetical protein